MFLFIFFWFFKGSRKGIDVLVFIISGKVFLVSFVVINWIILIVLFCIRWWFVNFFFKVLYINILNNLDILMIIKFFCYVVDLIR